MTRHWAISGVYFLCMSILIGILTSVTAMYFSEGAFWTAIYCLFGCLIANLTVTSELRDVIFSSMTKGYTDIATEMTNRVNYRSIVEETRKELVKKAPNVEQIKPPTSLLLCQYFVIILASFQSAILVETYLSLSVVQAVDFILPIISVIGAFFSHKFFTRIAETKGSLICLNELLAGLKSISDNKETVMETK